MNLALPAEPSSRSFSPVEVREAQIRDRKRFIRDSVEYCANKEEFEANFFKEFK